MPYSIVITGICLLLLFLFLGTPLAIFTIGYPPVLFAVLFGIGALVVALLVMPAEVVLRRRTSANWRILGLLLPILAVTVLAIDHVRVGRFATIAEANAGKVILYERGKHALVFERLDSNLDLLDPSRYALLKLREAGEVYEIINGQSFVLRTVQMSPKECDRFAEDMRSNLVSPKQLGGWFLGSCVTASPEKPDLPIVKVELEQRIGSLRTNWLNKVRITAPDRGPVEVYEGSYFGRFGCVKTGSLSRTCGLNPLVLATLGISD